MCAQNCPYPACGVTGELQQAPTAIQVDRLPFIEKKWRIIFPKNKIHRIEKHCNIGRAMDSRPIRRERRRRVAVACSGCRARKTKCDARKPTCSTCIAAGEACDYSSEGIHHSTKVLVNKELVHLLDGRKLCADYQLQLSSIIGTPVGAV